MPSTTRTLGSILAGAATAAAHGFVSNVVINGVSYQGYDVTKFPYSDDNPVVIGWGTSATDLGFVAPDAFSGPDIICHRDGANAQGFATVAAGDSIFLQWNTWPDSHHGPVMDYLAPCGDAGCASVDKTTLEFFKIDQVGLVDGSSAPGQYGSDELLANSVGWMVQIPADVAPGNYVLRHEIIALHSAGQENGAQAYPQCFNLEITGSGTSQPAGVLGTELYTATDEGILFNIYETLTDYPVPGPAVIDGASAVEQATSAIAETGTATSGAGSGSGASSTATSAAATSAAATTAAPTSADAQPTTTVAASTSADAQPTTVASSTDAAPTASGTPAPSFTTIPSGGDQTASTPSSGEQPVPTPPTDSCQVRKAKKAKKHGKTRRHVRDVKALNVAPIRR